MENKSTRSSSKSTSSLSDKVERMRNFLQNSWHVVVCFLYLIFSKIVTAFRWCIQLACGWIIDIRNKLTAPDGWELLTKAFVFLVGSAGLLVTIQTYQTQVRNTQLQNSNNEFARLVDEFNSESEDNRILALARAPTVMATSVPSNNSISLTESISSIVGLHLEEIRPHLADIRRLIFSFSHRGKSVTQKELVDWIHSEKLVEEKKFSTQYLSKRESQALIDFLVEVGPEGWYGRKFERNTKRRTYDELKWIWTPPPSELQDSRFFSPAGLFSNTTIKNPDFRRYDLSGADFRSSRIFEGNFTNIRAPESRFDNALLDSADFSHATLIDATFEHSSLRKAIFAGAALTGANFQYSDLRNALLHDANIQGATFFNARLDHAKLNNVNHSQNLHSNTMSAIIFQNCQMPDAYLANAQLHGAIFSHSVMPRVKFTNAKLKFADFSYVAANNADFSYTQLSHASFVLTDLTSANLKGAQGVLEIEACLDANIAKVSGLSEEEIKHLLQKGAVQIPDPKEWTRYKLDGRPHDKWKEYAGSHKTSGSKP